MSKNLTAILKILLYTAIFSTTLPLVFFLFFKLNKKQRALRVILLYVLYCIFNEGMSFYLQKIKSEDFSILLYSFTIIEFSFFCYFIYLILPKNFVKKIVPYLWAIFVLIALIDIFYLNKTHDFDSFASGIESIIIITLCIYYLFSQIKGSNSSLIYSTFNFWVVIAFLIYFAGTFFLYLFADNMISNPSFHKIYFIINITFNILKNILLSVAMTMKLNEELYLQKSAIPELDEDIFFHAKKQLP